MIVTGGKPILRGIQPDLSKTYHSKPREFDGIDIHITQQKQVDANIPINQIAKDLGLGYRRALRRYEHVRSRGLIQSYGLNWIGTGYAQELGKAMTARHIYVGLDLLIKDVGQLEIWKLRSELLDQKLKKWLFNPNDALTRLDELLLSTKQSPRKRISLS